MDPGAHDNLTGDDWVKRVRRICAVYGLDVINKPLENELSVGGVGKGSQTCTETADVPIALADGGGGNYLSPVVRNSQMPALLGNKTMTRMRTILNLGDGKFIIPGPGAVVIKLPPNSRVLDMEMSDSGHWMLPITEYKRQSKACETASFATSYDQH